MKTAEEILRECTQNTVYSVEAKIKQLTKAMKLYANQKLDEAAEKGKYKYIEINGHLGSSIIEESILSLKDQI